MTAVIPVESLLDDRLGIVGTTGSGKTYAAGVLVESIMAKKHRVIIVDPLGVWYGLRLRADGEVPSLFDPVIFGGRHGDLPLTEHAGQVVGEAVATSFQSCIVDLSQLGTKAAERRFMLAFLTALYRATESSPVHIIFDEADMWAPQVLLEKDGESARLLGMMETLIRRGRIKGFVPWLITQRPAVLSKNVLSQIDGIIAMKLTSSQDRDAIGLWVEGQADRAQWNELRAALATMQRGEGLIWIPGRNVMKTATFPAKTTFDSSRTPRRGEAKSKVALMSIDLGALKEKLAAVEQETKASDPAVLRSEIHRLRKELDSTRNSKPADIDATWNAAFKAGDEQGYNRAVRIVTDGLSAAVTAAIKGYVSPGIGVAAVPARPRAAQPRALPGHTVEGRGIASNQTAPPRTAGAASPSARAILSEIHKSYPIGLSFDAAARRAGISKRSSAYRKYRAEVMESGEVEGDEARLVSTPGHGGGEPMAPGASVDTWASRLPPSFGAILKAVAAGHRMKADIAAAANVSPTSSGLGSGLRELMNLELVQQIDSGEYVLSEGM